MNFTPPTELTPISRPAPLLAERTEFLDGDAPAAAKVEAFLSGNGSRRGVAVR